jgi:adenylate cyclase
MGRFRKFIQKPFVIVMVGGLLSFLIVLGLRKSGSLELLELTAYDWFIRMEIKISRENARITLIKISEKDIQSLGHWPLTDKVIATALKILLNGRPRAIGVDIYRDILVPPGSEELNALFIKNPNTIGVMTVGDKGVAPLAVIKNTDQSAFGDIIIDPGGTVRRALLFLDDGKNSFTSLALRLSSLYLEKEGVALQPDPANQQFVRFRNTTITPLEENDGGYRKADARGYQFLLDFADSGSTFRSYSFTDLLTGRVPSEAISERIILVGVDAQSVKDHFFTPLSRGFTEGQQISGVDLHALVASQLLRIALDGDLPIKMPTERHNIAWLLVWSLLGSVIGFGTRSALRFSLIVAGSQLALLGMAYYSFISHWWIPLVPPALSFLMAAVGVTAYMTGLEKRERAVLMEIFSKHVSKEVAEMIWHQRDQFLDNGRPCSRNMMVTVFFSDLKGFTAVSEKMPPQELIDWLNTYMESMAGLIMEHGGVVDSYAGDGIKADFGVPLPRMSEVEVRRDATNAVDCALAMQREMHRLNGIWKGKGHPEMGIRIGLFTGPVVGGLLGSSQRLKYTTIGDTVNIASRLESYDKDVAKDSICRILIGDSTLRCIGDRYKTEEIGEVSLKGKNEKIIIHRVLAGEPATT